MAGIDIGVHRSDRRARVGKLTRQGSPQLRWALYEAARSACRPTSPDHADYLALKARGLSHTRASLTIARKLARRFLPRPGRTRPRRPGPNRHTLTSPDPPDALPPHAQPSSMITLPASSLSCAAPTHRWRPTIDRAAGVTSPGLTDQPSR